MTAHAASPVPPGGTPDLTSSFWQGLYDEGKTGWDRGGPNPMLREWLERRVLVECGILVPGCGRGHEVVALAEAGFRVTAVDYAESAVNSLRAELARRGLDATVVQADLFQFCPAAPFDAIYEQTCLCAIDPGQRSTYAQSLARWLRPGGKLFALFMQTGKPGGPPFHCPLEEMRELFQTGWKWEGEPKRVEHPAGLHELACVLERV
jgi:SAM-dependent methyltransferase